MYTYFFRIHPLTSADTGISTWGMRKNKGIQVIALFNIATLEDANIYAEMATKSVVTPHKRRSFAFGKIERIN